MKKEIVKNLKLIGFKVENKSVEDLLEELLELHIQILMEIEQTDIETFRRELKRVLKPTN